MFFKNAHLLSLDPAFKPGSEQLLTALEKGRFQPITSLEVMKLGWVAPIGKHEDSPLVHSVNGCHLICLQREEKILPAAVVNELLAEKIADIEEAKGTPVCKKKRDELRDEIIHDLLPRAFSFSRKLYAYLDMNTGWLVVDTPSPAKAEELCSVLRKGLDSLPASLPTVANRPAMVMTQWWIDRSGPTPFSSSSIPDAFSSGNDCKLVAVDESKAEVTLKKSDLASDELYIHLDHGKEVVQISMSWLDRISFTLDESLRIKRLRFLDLVQEKRADIEAEDEAARLDADFAIMTGELAEFIPELVGLFGGLVKKS